VDSSELAGKRVLIVDDNATNRKILMRQLDSWEMTNKDTDSPKQALKWIADGEDFDAAILDMHMPEMDGLELALEIRKTEAGKDIPLLMLTSLGGREEVRAEERVEFAAFLTKPIKPSQLFNALGRVFIAGAEPSQPKTEAPALDSNMADRLPLRILLAEDNVINQKVALRILSRLGYRADVAGNGLEAIDALERQPYDVVLMDMQMPELDGLDATRRIRKEIANRRP
jgi:CheY-like chemotaxis protein